LRLAANDGDDRTAENCSGVILGNQKTPVRSSCGIDIMPSTPLISPTDFDYIAVLGEANRRHFEMNDQRIEFLRRVAQLRVPLIGICTGSFTLARAELMRGRRCCVGWNLYRVMRDEFPDVIPVGDQSFVVDRDRLTCAGGVTAAHLAAWLIEKHCGRAISKKALQLLFIDRALPPQTAQPQPPLLPNAANKHVRRAMLVIEQNLSEPLQFDEIARRIHISQRQLTRVFEEEFGQSPSEFSRVYRLKCGLWLLLHSNRSITDIAAECGFSDLSHFSREFRRQFSKPPSEVRTDGTRTFWGGFLNGDPASEGGTRRVNRRHRAFV